MGIVMDVLRELRTDAADWLQGKANRDRSMIYGARERTLREIGLPREHVLPHLQRTRSWKSGDLALAWADFWDAVAKSIRPSARGEN